MGYSVTITNTNSKKMRFYDGETPDLSYRGSNRLFKQPLPDEEAEDAIVINLGASKELTFPFKLTNTTEDAAVGTHTSTVKTISEKFNYLDGVFITNGIEDLYTIEITANNGVTFTKTGTLENFEFLFSKDKITSLPGSLGFSIGGGSQ